MADTDLPRVVIVGGGFAGLYAARALGRAPGLRVTLVDRRNHHLFQPLLYQVATAALNPSEIAAPIRGVLRRGATEVQMAEVTRVDVAARKVLLTDGALAYDYLIVATGATHSYFGHSEWARHATGLKTIEDALHIRKQVLLAYERAEREPDPARRRAHLTFVIVGAGPTGVELAGALAEISRYALRRDFRHIDPSSARVLLLEGMDHVLPTYPPELSQRARRALERLGVEVRTGARVTQVAADGVRLGEEWILAQTVLWAAGVAASPLATSLGAPLDRAGRVRVTPFLNVPGHPEVFVVGDLAALEQDGKPIPGVAPAAIQEGKHAARNVLRAVRGQALAPFRYWDRGTFSVIGRGAAVGMAFGGLRMSGPMAWLAWLVIHIFFLIGFRNRLLVLIQWAFSYLTFRRGARLITFDSATPALPGDAPARAAPEATAAPRPPPT